MGIYEISSYRACDNGKKTVGDKSGRLWIGQIGLRVKSVFSPCGLELQIESQRRVLEIKNRKGFVGDVC